MARKPNKLGWDAKGRMRLRITIPVPPTDNHIYSNVGRARFLTSTAKKYKKMVANEVAKLAVTCDPDAGFHEDVPYEIILQLYLDKVENSGWAQGKAKSRYKRIDTTNRQKLVIDGVMEGIGVDDCHIFYAALYKKCDATDPRLVLTVREQEARRG